MSNLVCCVYLLLQNIHPTTQLLISTVGGKILLRIAQKQCPFFRYESEPNFGCSSCALSLRIKGIYVFKKFAQIFETLTYDVILFV